MSVHVDGVNLINSSDKESSLEEFELDLVMKRDVKAKQGRSTKLAPASEPALEDIASKFKYQFR